ncbi:EamA family transporter [Candidatus Bathyarchaeota archaeon]|nr:EamA family transporter [Candidatus Bathyarchaeota archaeon]
MYLSQIRGLSVSQPKGGNGEFHQASSYGLLIVLSMFWGLAFVAIRRAVAELSPANLALLRWLIASPCFLIIILFVSKSKNRFERRDLPRLLMIALLMVPLYIYRLILQKQPFLQALLGFFRL